MSFYVMKPVNAKYLLIASSIHSIRRLGRRKKKYAHDCAAVVRAQEVTINNI